MTDPVSSSLPPAQNSLKAKENQAILRDQEELQAFAHAQYGNNFLASHCTAAQESAELVGSLQQQLSEVTSYVPPEQHAIIRSRCLEIEAQSQFNTTRVEATELWLQLPRSNMNSYSETSSASCSSGNS